MTVLRLREDSVFWRESDGEIVALDADASRYYSANPSAAVLWKRLAEGATEADLAETLRARYGLAPDAAEKDVRTFLDDLAARGLLER
jgi:Coenzyme PQQ synthesis protein D (PqqD)